jgi:hypothetical protein
MVERLVDLSFAPDREVLSGLKADMDDFAESRIRSNDKAVIQNSLDGGEVELF